MSPSDPLTLTLTVWKEIGYASYHDQQQTMSVCACQTHNSFQLLFLSTIGGILGDGINQKGVLGESLHWWEVPQLQTMTSWSCLKPLRFGGIEMEREEEGSEWGGRGREGGTNALRLFERLTNCH